MTTNEKTPVASMTGVEGSVSSTKTIPSVRRAAESIKPTTRRDTFTIDPGAVGDGGPDLLSNEEIDRLILAVVEGAPSILEDDLMTALQWCHEAVVGGLLVQRVLDGSLRIECNASDPDQTKFKLKANAATSVPAHVLSAARNLNVRPATILRLAHERYGCLSMSEITPKQAMGVYVLTDGDGR